MISSDFQLMNAIADVESESSQSQDTESAFSIKDENASDFNQIDDDSQEGPKPLNFQTKTVKGETFYLVPEFLVKFVPTYPVEEHYLEGVGAVEVGERFTYIQTDLLIQLTETVSQSVDLQAEVKLLREHLWSRYGKSDELPPFDPEALQTVAISAGANKLFSVILNAMSSEDKPVHRQALNKKKAVTIIYMLMFGQSQKASWYQKVMSNMVVGKGISEGGLSVLHKSGIAVSKSTQRRDFYKIAESHESLVKDFIADAIERKALLILMIDDFTNIHTKRRPTDHITSKARNMATILMKRFCDGSAIPVDQHVVNPDGICQDMLLDFTTKMLSSLSTTFASSMPYWIRTAFFDPEMERSRIEIHDYQEHQTGERAMRKMDGCKLIDELEIPLKGFHNFRQAACHAIDNGLDSYLSNFICPQPGDWPAQFYMRQVQLHAKESDSCPFLQHIVPFIGPLHIQLNARECVCLLNIEFFKKAYTYIFGENKVLANKPQAWRISFLLEVLYGGWTLIRDQIIVAFSNCKDIQYLTLLNLLDNYIPLVLSIYSVIFKSGNTEMFASSLFRCWVMFFCYKRHHYDKAPLVWLSNFLYWKSIDHPLYHTLMNMLNAFDEYPVENFHSHLRAETQDHDCGDMLRKKAKGLDSRKDASLSFVSTFVVPKKYTFKRGRLEQLKMVAAKFLITVLEDIKDHPNNASEVPRPRGKKKNFSYWKLPQIYGEENVVASKVLPLGFQFPGKEPNASRSV
ncbi:uncharacterized protein LOC135688497 [Rhopilema esculentum]|uniref:uncharacterized protein LOC135688497 n=1 Tax=Rhopilema esculentum TaxID=499914 RepID=UPI0031E3CC7C